MRDARQQLDALLAMLDDEATRLEAKPVHGRTSKSCAALLRNILRAHKAGTSVSDILRADRRARAFDVAERLAQQAREHLERKPAR